MAEGFTDVWRTVRLYVPVAPLFLVQDWVNEAWKTLARTRPWSFLRGELALTINAARTVASVTVTRGSARRSRRAGIRSPLHRCPDRGRDGYIVTVSTDAKSSTTPS